MRIKLCQHLIRRRLYFRSAPNSSLRHSHMFCRITLAHYDCMEDAVCYFGGSSRITRSKSTGMLIPGIECYATTSP